MKMSWVWAIGLFCVCVAGFEGRAGEKMPEFGSSVAFDKSVSPMSIERLKGKAVVVMFFQSWCPKCNEWAPKLITQVQEAHGTNRGVVLLAIKTDGGSINDAKAYLKDKQATLSKWIVGTDRDAEYYKEVTGKNELWQYALVDTTGTIAGQGQSGAYFTSGPDTGKFMLACSGTIAPCGKPRTVLPAAKQYPASLDEIVRCAELGALSDALKRCTAAMAKSKEQAALTDLKKDILGAAESVIVANRAILDDATQEWGARYDAYKALDPLPAELQTYPSVKEVRAFVQKMARDPAILKEKAAETAYLKAKEKLKKASTRDKPNVLKELSAIGKKYSDTQYGKLALADAEGK